MKRHPTKMRYGDVLRGRTFPDNVFMFVGLDPNTRSGLGAYLVTLAAPHPWSSGRTEGAVEWSGMDDTEYELVTR